MLLNHMECGNGVMLGYNFIKKNLTAYRPRYSLVSFVLSDTGCGRVSRNNDSSLGALVEGGIAESDSDSKSNDDILSAPVYGRARNDLAVFEAFHHTTKSSCNRVSFSRTCVRGRHQLGWVNQRISNQIWLCDRMFRPSCCYR